MMVFPMGFKKLTLTLLKDDLFEKTNYRSSSVLPILSKAFERCPYDQSYELIYYIIYYRQYIIQGLMRF